MPRGPADRPQATLRSTNNRNLHSPGVGKQRDAEATSALRDRIAQLEAELAAAYASIALTEEATNSGDPCNADATLRPATAERLPSNSFGETMQAYGIIALDPEGCIVSCNCEAARIYGLSDPATVEGRQFSSFYPAEEAAAGKPERDLHLAAEQGEYEEDIHRFRPNGEQFSALTTICPLRNDRGELRGFVTLLRDVTLRHRDEERSRFMFELALNAMVVVNNRGEIVLVNPQTEKMFGYASDELIGQPVDVLVPENLRDLHPFYLGAFFSASGEGGAGGGRDLFGQRKDGSKFPVEIGLNSIQTDNGLLVVGSVVDVTTRKRAEEKFRLAVESAPSAMVMMNESGEIVLVNLQTEKLFGYDRESLLGQPIEQLAPAFHPEFRQEFFENPTAKSMGLGRDLVGRRHDGAEFPVEISVAPLDTDEGLLVLVSIVDITERRMADERSRRHLAEMAHAGRLSTIGEMFSGLAHEINQPLAAAANYARACVRFARDDASATREQLIEWMEKAAGQADRASAVVQRVGRFVHRGPASHAALDINEIIGYILALPMMDFVPGEASSRIVPELDLAERMPPVAGDRVQIEQVLVNLIRNATDALSYVPPEGRRIVVKTAVVDGEVQVLVYDTGRGISDEEMSQLFTRFFTTKNEGMGLGLSISRSIIEAHAGCLWAESNIDGGATFLFTLPIFVEEVPPC